MIVLITGAPGAGKSAYLVSELMRLRESEPHRPLFVGGVPELTLEHEVLPPPDQWVEAAETANGWRWKFPDGAVLVLDEAQSVFRPRAAGAAVPPWVAALEVHRHQGLDVYLCTQAPSLIDSNVRRLVGRHVHLRAQWSGRQLLEWSECTDPSSRGNRTAAVSRPFRLPKKTFAAYKSASLHVKQKRRVPWQLWMVGLLLVGVGLGAWRVYDRWYGGETYGVAPDAVAGSVDGEGGEDLRLMSSARSAGVALTAEAFVPRLRDRPESAPLYDEVRKINHVPIVAGCVAAGDRCTCYTQQGTDAFLEPEVCRAWIENRPFQPFAPPREQRREIRAARWQGERSEADDSPPGPRVYVIEDGDRLAEASASQSVSSSLEGPRPPNRGVQRFPRMPGL